MPVVFIHGLWLLASSWARWAALFESAGYSPVLVQWPGEPATVEAARAQPEAMAGRGVGEVAEHMAGVIRSLRTKPAVIGHSFGGLLTQMMAGRGLAAVSVAVDPAPFRGVLPVPPSAFKAASPVLLNPANRRRAVMLTFEQFRYAFSNAVAEAEARELYDTFAVPAPGAPVFQAAVANLNPRTEVRVDTMQSNRGPLLIIGGDKDNTVPWAIAHASYRRQKRNRGFTDIKKMAGRGHSLVIDSGWNEVASLALEFVREFAR
jgi:non-heme chloroperoxidase